MLNTALTSLRTLLKAEVGNELSVQTAQDTALTQLLLMGQRDLADRFDWPHLRKSINVSVAASTQYVNLPSSATIPELNFDRPVSVSVRQGGMWLPVGYGISEVELNTSDFSLGQTSGPLMKWQMYGASQFEVWPVGNAVQTMRFTGQLRVVDLSETVNATLDDLLLVYYVAAEYLTRLKNPQATLEISKFNSRYSQLIRNTPSRSGIHKMGGRIAQFEQCRRLVTIAGGGSAAGALGGSDGDDTIGSDTITIGDDETFIG